jgi:D-alanyl-D-alanine dipeptidase
VEIVSNAEYVADPAKGSIHNRGGAVDITLVDKNGKEIWGHNLIFSNRS